MRLDGSAGRLLVFALVLTVTQNGTGTSIVVVKPNAGVLYLAADSLYGGKNGRLQFCKIHQLGHLYWAAATTFYKDPRGFYLEKLVTAVGPDNTVDSATTRFIKIAKNRIATELVSLGISRDKRDTADYADIVFGLRSPLEIVFVGIEDGKPRFQITRFFASRRKSQVFVTASREKIASPPSASGAGYWKNAASYIADRPSQFESNPGKTIGEGLETEISADPEHVGRPISIIRFDRNGAEWTERGTCDF